MDKEHKNFCMLRSLPEQLQAEAGRLSVEENPANLADGAQDNPSAVLAVIQSRWKPGRTLRVHFMDGDPIVHANVEKYAREWEKYANIHFKFVHDPKAEIRISFKQSGYWSYLGTESLAISKDEPTMNFEGFNRSTPQSEYSRVVLHEFGHALGCVHEHQNPKADIPWDKPAVYRYYMGEPNCWTRKEIDENLFYRYDSANTPGSAFDPESIMVYPIPNDQTLGDFEVEGNNKLSRMDKQFIGKMYPGARVSDAEPVSARVHEAVRS